MQYRVDRRRQQWHQCNSFNSVSSEPIFELHIFFLSRSSVFYLLAVKVERYKKIIQMCTRKLWRSLKPHLISDVWYRWQTETAGQGDIKSTVYRSKHIPHVWYTEHRITVPASLHSWTRHWVHPITQLQHYNNMNLYLSFGALYNMIFFNMLSKKLHWKYNNIDQFYKKNFFMLLWMFFL